MTESLNLNLQITISDILAALSLLTIIAGGIFTFVKWNRNKKLIRSEYLQQLIEKIRKDNSSAFYLIEYDHDWYNENFHGNEKIEKRIDYTLTYFNYICYLKQHGIITNKEFRLFEYQIKRIFHNRSMINYLYNLYHFSSRCKTPVSFPNLFEFAKKNRLFNTQFWDKDSYKENSIYNRYLNF